MKESAISALLRLIPVEKRFLGRILKEIYEVKLAHDFPDRRFIVEFNDALVDGSLDDDQLTFWQI